MFAEELDSPFFSLYIFLLVADKIAVPIFFMIAGALLLGKGNYYLSSDISVPIFTSKCIFYALMGYYAERVLDINNVKKRDIVACILASLIAIGISCFMTMYRADITGELSERVSQEFHERLIAIPTISTYVLVKYIFVKHKISIKLQNVILLIGSTTFGVYLIEGMLRSYLYL